MARNRETTNAFRDKIVLVRTTGGGADHDATTAFRTYLDTVISTAASAARQDLTTRAWLDITSA